MSDNILTERMPFFPKQKRNVKINIATPSYGSSYSGNYVRSLYSLLTASSHSGVEFSFSDVDFADIAVSRNYLVSNFFYNKKDCDYILMIDDDMGFNGNLIYKMIELDKEVVGVIAPRRKIDLQKLHSLSGVEFEKAFAKSCSFIGKTLSDCGNGFFEVDSCGAGILLISRQCIETMVDQCPEIVDQYRYKKFPFASRFSQFITPFNKVQLEKTEFSEDLSFCYRWKKLCGGKIYANGAEKVQHVSELVIESRYTDSF